MLFKSKSLEQKVEEEKNKLIMKSMKLQETELDRRQKQEERKKQAEIKRLTA